MANIERIPINPLYLSLKYSLRRYFVDEFLTRQIPGLATKSLVLDLGGSRITKRGQFDIEGYPLRIVYLNLSTIKRPHIQADAARLPFSTATFGAIICTEVLEHVPDPQIVLHEAARVLRPGGILLITVPFLFGIHADPYDFGRYTDHYWSQTLKATGFGDSEIEKQGLFWSVLVDLLRGLAQQMASEGRLSARLIRTLIVHCLGWGRRRALSWDMRPENSDHPFFGRFTTGFGIRAVKPLSETE